MAERKEKASPTAVERVKAEIKKETKEPAEHTDRYLIFKNPDKGANGKKSSVAPWMPLTPCRILFFGPPEVGKRCALLNIATRFDPAPSEIHVLHLDPDTKEYKVLGKVCSKKNIHFYTPDHPPNFADIGATGSDKHSVLIVDEVPCDTLSKQARSDLERLVSYASSHRNCSVLMCFQRLTSITPAIRSAFSHFVLWNGPDKNALSLAAVRIGVPGAELEDLMTMMEDKHDSLMVDATVHPDSIWRYRQNLMEPIYRIGKDE
jgi:hypothetical protein